VGREKAVRVFARNLSPYLYIAARRKHEKGVEKCDEDG